MFRRDDGVIDTSARRPADAPTWPFSVRVLAVGYVLSYAVQPVAFLGLTGTMVLVVIAIGSIWPVLLATVHGVSSVEPRLVEVGQSLRLNRFKTMWKITLPNAQADILAGMRIGLTVALILAVIGEMLTSENGLGWYVLQAARAYHSADLFAGVIVLGIIGLVSNLALQEIERYVLRWKRR